MNPSAAEFVPNGAVAPPAPVATKLDWNIKRPLLPNVAAPTYITVPNSVREAWTNPKPSPPKSIWDQKVLENSFTPNVPLNVSRSVKQVWNPPTRQLNPNAPAFVPT